MAAVHENAADRVLVLGRGLNQCEFKTRTQLSPPRLTGLGVVLDGLVVNVLYSKAADYFYHFHAYIISTMYCEMYTVVPFK